MRATFVLSQVRQGLSKNLAMTISVILVTFVSLLFVGSAALLQMQINNMRDEWYDKIEITVSMCAVDDPMVNCAGKEASPEEIAAVGEALQGPALAKYVAKVYFEDKDQAYASFQQLFADNPVAQYTTKDMLPVSYRIKLVDPQQYQVVVESMSSQPGVAQVQDQRQVLEPLFLVMNRATYLSVGLAGVMAIAAVLLITTTIRLSAMARQEETEIMRLVGASNLFIQLPFILEGAVAALIGSLLASGGLWAGVHFLVQDWLAGSMTFFKFVDGGDVGLISIFLVLAAIVLAGLSSMVSLGRYTKV